MKILKWAAVAVTALFALMNLGVVPDSGVETGWRAYGAVMAVAGAAAAIGLATDQRWGRVAVIGAGGINLAASVIGLFADQPGGATGIVVGGLGVVLGVLAAKASTWPAAARS